MDMRTKVFELLSSDLSSYRIGKDTGIPRGKIGTLREDMEKVGSMSFNYAERLAEYYDEYVEQKSVEAKEIVSSAKIITLHTGLKSDIEGYNDLYDFLEFIIGKNKTAKLFRDSTYEQAAMMPKVLFKNLRAAGHNYLPLVSGHKDKLYTKFVDGALVGLIHEDSVDKLPELQSEYDEQDKIKHFFKKYSDLNKKQNSTS